MIYKPKNALADYRSYEQKLVKMMISAGKDSERQRIRRESLKPEEVKPEVKTEAKEG